jgi:hypothetical protein
MRNRCIIQLVVRRLFFANSWLVNRVTGELRYLIQEYLIYFYEKHVYQKAWEECCVPTFLGCLPDGAK